MAKLRAAVIGLGRMGSTFDDEIREGGTIYTPYCHVPSYVAHEGTELVAGADPHDGQRAAFAERWGLDDSHLYVDYKEMLEKEDIDIISVTTTAKIRAEIVQHAAQCGLKAMWLEKPIALSLEEADAMLSACEKNGVVVAVNCARRWNPDFITTRRMIDEGELGDVLQVTAYGACSLSHNGSHLIDTANYLAGGKVEWVFGEMASDEAAEKDFDLQGNGYLAYDNGVRGYARSMSTGSIGWEFEVLGTAGVIRSQNNAKQFVWRYVDTGRSGRKPVTAERVLPKPVRPEGMGITIVKDIVSGIEKGTKPLCDGEDGRHALEIAIAMRESHRRGGQKVVLPLEDRSLKILSSETLGGDEPAIVRRQRRLQQQK